MALITKRRGGRKGFTLIELAIIIAIVGILAAVGAVKYNSMTTEAKAAGVQSAVANARSGLAIAIAKSSTGKVALTDLMTQLEGSAAGTGNTFTMDGKYTVTFSGSPTDVQSIVSATAN